MSVPAMTAPAPATHRVEPGLRAASTRAGRWAALAVAAASGLLLLAAFPPIGAWPLAPVAVAGLTLACRGRRARTGLLLGFIFGAAFFVPLLRWSGIFVGPLPWLLLATAEAVVLAPLGWALTLLTRLRAWPLWTAAAWVAEEALRDRAPFGGFPWGRLAFSQGHTSFTGWASVGGAPLLTAAVALVGGLLAAALLLAAHRRRASAGTLLVAALVAGASGALISALPDGTSVTRRAVIALVQGNVPRLGLPTAAQARQVLANHLDATAELAAAVRAGERPAPEAVIWPENATDLDPLANPQVGALLNAAAADVGVPMLVGAVLDGPGRYIRNAGLVWSPAGGAEQIYVKQHPVPFAEYIPLRGVARLVSDKVDLVSRDFTAGTEPGVLQMGGITLGDVICFEVAYDGIVRDVVTRGAQVLTVQTNNATFGRSGETEQQLAMSQVRAVEHGRAVLVAATSGISAVVGPDGAVLDSAPVFTREVLDQAVPLMAGHTVATRLGSAPEWALVAVTLLGLGLALRRRSTR